MSGSTNVFIMGTTLGHAMSFYSCNNRYVGLAIGASYLFDLCVPPFSAVGRIGSLVIDVAQLIPTLVRGNTTPSLFALQLFNVGSRIVLDLYNKHMWPVNVLVRTLGFVIMGDGTESRVIPENSGEDSPRHGML